MLAVEVAEGARISRNITVTPSARIRGVVVDEQRRPVPAARVTMNRSPGQATTGPDGAFLIRPQRSTQPLTVLVVKSGYASGSAGPVAIQPGEIKNVQVTLRRGFHLEIQVVDPDGNPIAGEPISLMRWNDPDDKDSRVPAACSESDPALCFVTDAKGRREYDLVDGKFDIMAGGKTARQKMLSQTLDARSKPLTITLDRGVVVEGRVVNADNQPVEGAIVAPSNRATSATSATTDAAGAFVLRNLAPGVPLTLFAELRSGLEGETVTVTPPASDVVLRLPRPARIEGRVVDRESKQPVHEFSINLPRARRGMPPQTKKFTADDGRFAIEDVTPGELELNVTAKGYAPGSVAALKAVEGATASVEIALDRGIVVTGRVTAGGRPVPDVVVFNSSNRGPRQQDVRTDASGEFTVDSVTAGSQRFEFRKQGFVTKSAAIDVTSGRENRLDVELTRGRELQGRVVDSAGRPIATADVLLRNAPGVQSPVTDAEGAFRVEGLDDQKYLLIVRKEGYLNGELEVNPAQTPTVTITLGRGGSISGRVVNADTEMQNVEVVGIGGTMWRSVTHPDPAGNFVLQGVPDGRVEVRAAVLLPVRRGSESKFVDVENGTGPFVQLDFKSGLLVRGRVTRRGQPVEGTITFSATTPSAARYSSYSEIGGGGDYQVQLPDAGEYVVRVQQRNGRGAAARKVSVTGAMTYDVDVSGATVRGHVVDEKTGAPIAGAIVSLGGSVVPGASITVEAPSDTNGRFSFSDVADEQYRISARKEHYVSEPQEIVVGGGDPPEVEVRVRKGDSVGVKVIDAADGRLLDASIFPRLKGGSTGYTPAGVAARGESGAQQLWLLPGTYTADIWMQGYVRRTIELQVPGPDVEVRLERGGTVVVRGSVAGGVLMRLRAGATRAGMAPLTNPRFESIAPGVYTLEVLDAQQKVLAAREGVTVTAGQTTTVTLD